MQYVGVRYLQGGHTVVIMVNNPDTTVGGFRRLVAEKLGLQPVETRIILCGKELKDDAVPIREYRFEAETVVHAVRRSGE